MITSKETASQLATASQNFVEALSRALIAEQAIASPSEFEQLKRAVGMLIGQLETELLVPLYCEHPELEPESHRLDRD